MYAMVLFFRSIYKGTNVDILEIIVLIIYWWSYAYSMYLLSLQGENIFWPETGNIILPQKVWTWSKDNGGISEEHRRL